MSKTLVIVLAVVSLGLFTVAGSVIYAAQQISKKMQSDYQTLPNRIKELEDAAASDNADNFKAIVGLRKYLEQRKGVLELQIEFGYTGEVISDSSTFMAERKQLKKWGKYYAYKYPAFENMWNSILSKELDG